jgi:hypothetical protein
MIEKVAGGLVGPLMQMQTRTRTQTLKLYKVGDRACKGDFGCETNKGEQAWRARTPPRSAPRSIAYVGICDWFGFEIQIQE